MIIRQTFARHVRCAFASSIPRARFRLSSTATHADSIEASLENSRSETGAIESQINQRSPYGQAVTPLDADDSQDDTSVSDALEAFRHHQRTNATLGTTITDHYKPHTLLSDPPGPADVTLELLLAAQAHMGHSTSLWNPANQRYIFGVRQGIHIISLDITAAHLRRAAKVVSGVCERAGLVLFVGTRDGQDRCVVSAAQRAGGCHLFERWIPGSITNRDQILGSCRIKVVDQFDEEVEGYKPQLEQNLALKPDLVVCLNPLENYVLLHECGLNNIPTVGIVDTDVDPTWVTYPIPANDDSLRCVQTIAGVLSKAGEEGQKRRMTAAKEGRVTYKRTHNLVSPERFGTGDLGRQREELDPTHMATANLRSR